jgi:radical SAM protein with 4Fe4S-binding SPASM domain
MYIKQSKNTFIRITPKYGYILNQLKRTDRVYDESGSVFLSQISRTPKEIHEVSDNLVKIFSDADIQELENDFMEFAHDLAESGYVVIGETKQEVEDKDEDFTYNVDIPFTMQKVFTQDTCENVSENTQDFFLEEVQGRPLISSLQFELSSQCNERCIHCYIPNAKKNTGRELPIETIKKVIDEFASIGGIHVTLSGGEAFLHPQLKEITQYCRKKDLKISILSNLIALKQSDLEWLHEANLSLIQTSLYSMDPEIHDKITTVRGSFERTKRAIEMLVAADIPVQISCPLMKANKDGYDKVLEYARKLKIKAQTDYIMMAQADLDTSNLANRLSIEETEKVIRTIYEYDLDYIDQTLMQKPKDVDLAFNKERFMAQPICGVGYDNCCITVNGDVYPCAGWQDYVLGNVLESSLKEIWENSQRVKDLRKLTNASFPKCCDCEAFNYCNRCLVRNYNESGGDMLKVPQHFCDIAFLNMRLVKEYEQKYLAKLSEQCQ